jgi:hypothetical protein
MNVNLLLRTRSVACGDVQQMRWPSALREVARVPTKASQVFIDWRSIKKVVSPVTFRRPFCVGQYTDSIPAAVRLASSNTMNSKKCARYAEQQEAKDVDPGRHLLLGAHAEQPVQNQLHRAQRGVQESVLALAHPCQAPAHGRGKPQLRSPEKERILTSA